MSVNFCNFEHLRKPLNSPRSVEICLLNGVDPVELLPRGVEEFRSVGGAGISAQRLWERAETRRAKLLESLRDQWRRLPPRSTSPPTNEDGSASRQRQRHEVKDAPGSQQRRRSTSPVSVAPSTVRSDLQRQHFAAIEEQQERDRALLAAKISEGLEAAQARKEAQLVSERRRRHHQDVADRLESLKEMDEAAQADKKEKFSLKQLRLEAARAGAASKRGWAPVERNLELKRKTEQVLVRQAEILAAEQRRHLAQWEEDMKRADVVNDRRSAEVQKRKDAALSIEKRVKKNNEDLAQVRRELAQMKERQRQEHLQALEARKEQQQREKADEMALQEAKRIEAANRREEVTTMERESKLESLRVDDITHHERLRIIESERIAKKEEELDRRLERAEAARRQRRALEYLKQRQILSKLK